MPKPLQTASAFANAHLNDVRQLIADYQRSARASVAALRQEFGARNLLRAWRQGSIPRSGAMSQPKGRYTFHGAGCRFEIDGRTIEVEFGPMGRHDGFDAWRLQQFAQSAFEWRGISPKRIETGLKDLASTQVIVQPGWAPSVGLFYFRQDISNGD